MTNDVADSDAESTDNLPVLREDGETTLAVYNGPTDD